MANQFMTIVRREEATNSTYCYVAFHPEFPNNMSQGDTPEEAEENLVEATELTLAHLKANNLPVPEPIIVPSGIPSLTLVFRNDYELTKDEIEYGKSLESLALEHLKI